MESKEEIIKIVKEIRNHQIDNQELSVKSPFQCFKSASNAILDEGRHIDEEDTNQLNKNEND